MGNSLRTQEYLRHKRNSRFGFVRSTKRQKKTEGCQVLWLKDEILHGRYFIIPAGDQGDVFSVLHHSCIHQFLSIYIFLSHMKKKRKYSTIGDGNFHKIRELLF